MRYVSTLFLLFALCACNATMPSSVKPYKLDVQQGNVVTAKMLLQLRPGMTKAQVRYVMGTPLIEDALHSNRWDYTYQMREGGKLKERRNVVLEFENELLKSVRSDVTPRNDIKTVERDTGLREIQPLQIEEKTLWDKFSTTTDKLPDQTAMVSRDNMVQSKDVAKNKSMDKQESGSWLSKLKFWESNKQANVTGNEVSKAAPVGAVAGAAVTANDNMSNNKDLAKNKGMDKQEGNSWLSKLKFWESNKQAVATGKEVSAAATSKSNSEQEVELVPMSASLITPTQVLTDNTSSPLSVGASNMRNKTWQDNRQNIALNLKFEKALRLGRERGALRAPDSHSLSKPSLFTRMLEKIGF